MKSALSRTILLTITMATNLYAAAQEPPDFSQLGDNATGRQAALAAILKSSLNRFDAVKGKPVSPEKKANLVEAYKDSGFEGSSDSEAAARSHQTSIRLLQRTESFHVKKQYAIFDSCAVTHSPETVSGGLMYHNYGFSCSFVPESMEESINVSDALVNDLKSILGGRNGWVFNDNETQRKNAKAVYEQRKKSYENARRTAQNEATVAVFKGLMDQAEKNLTREHFPSQTMSYSWTDENSPVHPGQDLKAPYMINISLGNSYISHAVYSPDSEPPDNHRVTFTVVSVNPVNLDE